MILAVPRKATWAPGPTETGETEAAPPGSPSLLEKQVKTARDIIDLYIIIYIYIYSLVI